MRENATLAKVHLEKGTGERLLPFLMYKIKNGDKPPWKDQWWFFHTLFAVLILVGGKQKDTF